MYKNLKSNLEDREFFTIPVVNYGLPKELSFLTSGRNKSRQIFCFDTRSFIKFQSSHFYKNLDTVCHINLKCEKETRYLLYLNERPKRHNRLNI